MNNVITALVTKRKSLTDRKREIKAECDRQCKEIDVEIGDLDAAIKVVNKAVEPYLCPVCGGTGNTRRCDAAGQMEDVECSFCRGSGIKMS